jgi:flagellar basal body-associated protein FliL
LKQDHNVGSEVRARKARSPVFIVLSILAFVFAVVFGVYETIPVKEQKAVASAQQAPAPVVPIEPEPARPKRGAR